MKHPPVSNPARNKPYAALVLGHPSHELRVYQWLIENKPLVFILTDGSANRGFPVSEHTKKVLTEKGIPQGTLFGAFPDRTFYEHVRTLDFPFFRGLAEHLAAALSDESIEVVAGDAIEGFNPTHDLCRLITNAAILVANLSRRRPLQNLDFALVGPVFDPEHAGREDLVVIRLTEEEKAEKIRVAKGYPGVEADVERALRTFGEESFSEECLRPVDEEKLFSELHDTKPAYERYGEERVRDGLYSFVIRYSEHLRPIQEDLARWTAERGVVGRA